MLASPCDWQSQNPQRKEELMSAVILTTGEASRKAELSAQYLRDLVRAGKLAAIRTERGQFLFEASEIERLVRERESQRRAKEEQ